MQGAMGLDILVPRKVTPGWANDPVWRYNTSKEREIRYSSGSTPPGRHRVSGRKGRSRLKKNSYIIIIYEA